MLVFAPQDCEGSDLSIVLLFAPQSSQGSDLSVMLMLASLGSQGPLPDLSVVLVLSSLHGGISQHQGQGEASGKDSRSKEKAECEFW